MKENTFLQPLWQQHLLTLVVGMVHSHPVESPWAQQRLSILSSGLSTHLPQTGCVGLCMQTPSTHPAPHLLPALLLLTYLKSTLFQAPLRSLPCPLLLTNGLSRIYCLSINSLYRTHVLYTFPLTPDLSNSVHGWNMTSGW